MLSRCRPTPWPWFVSVALLCSACGDKHADKDDESPASKSSPTENETNPGGVIDTEAPGTDPKAARVPCAAPDGVSNDPSAISEAVALINALPMPVSTVCLIEALKRPLRVNATTSRLSVQPAVDASTPRIFLFFGDLTITFVPEGDGAGTIEFSERSTVTTSVKAELAFPVSAPVAADAAYSRILRTDGVDGSTCSGCHDGETAAAGKYPKNAFASRAFRPRPANDVSLTSLEQQAEQCAGEESVRCDVLRALFDADVEAGKFPEEFPFMF
jgi:hypothetical protein